MRCLEHTKNDQTVEAEGVVGNGTSVKMEQWSQNRIKCMQPLGMLRERKT